MSFVYGVRLIQRPKVARPMPRTVVRAVVEYALQRLALAHEFRLGA